MTTTTALHDPLTGVPNQQYFDEHLDLAMGMAGRSAARLCLVVVEIDDLEHIGTQHGQAAVDSLLQTVAQRLRQPLRSSDFVARTGDTCFSLVLPYIDSMTGLERVADKLLASVQDAPITITGNAGTATLPIKAHLGLALYPDDGTTADDLRQLAHAAVQTARSTGTGWSLP